MPELPEVETVRRGLAKIIVGQPILAVEVLSEKSLLGEAQAAVGAKVVAVDRRGKLLLIELSNDLVLAIHLRMTGQLIFRDQKDENTFAGGHPTKSFLEKLPDGSTRVVFKLSNGTLFFNDQRKFGFVQVLPKTEVGNLKFVQTLAPEPFTRAAREQILLNLKRHGKAKIKAVLLDQQTVAGLGNIYADEALWMSRIHPETLVSKLSDQKLREVLENSAKVMKESISLGGTTFSDFRDVNGGEGEYFTRARAYGRAGQPCQRCGITMEKIKVAGRGSTFCPKCQQVRN